MDYLNTSIKLDSPRSVYYPGQVIKGCLEFEIQSPLTISVIYVNFIGEATVNWKEHESEEVNGQKRYKEVDYVGREEYFKLSQLLAGSHGSVLTLNPGKQSYPFVFNLPRGIPSSFAGERGAVKYWVSDRIEFQGRNLTDDSLKKVFEVVAPFDLNTGNASVREPVELEMEEEHGCGCFSSAPVTVRASTPVSAYCPGQAVPLAVAVDNKSSVEIRGLLFELLTRERYRTQRPVAEYVPKERVLLALKKGPIMSGNTRNFTVDLTVPDLIAPNLERCSIIDVGYFIRVTVKLSGCNSDMQDEAEICLGLVPLTETVDGTYVHPLAHSLPTDPIPADEGPEMKYTNQGNNTSANTQAHTQLPEGTSYFVQVNEQVISSDPSQNYQMGFKASYPPGSEVPPVFNQFNAQFSQLDTMTMNVLGQGFNLAVSFPPRSKTPEPSAPPM